MKKGKGFGDDFIKNLLLTLEETNFDEFMNLSYAVIMQSPSNVLKRDDSVKTKVDATHRVRNQLPGFPLPSRCL